MKKEQEAPPVGHKPVTIRDVSRHAGVGVATVSRVINHRGYVSARTRARVLAAIEELGFVPSGVARSLSTGRSGVVGLVIPDIRNPFFPDLVQAVDDTLRASGFTVMIGNTGERAETRDIVRALLHKGIDGLISFTFLDDRTLSLARRVPVVFVDRIPSHPPGDAVESDHAQGGWLAAEHLLSLGHRRLAVLRGPESAIAPRIRAESFVDVVRAAGAEVEVWQAESLRFEEGLRLGLEVLRRSPRPTAVFAANDLMALGVVRSAREVGMRVPEDVSVVGFDGIQMGSLATPALTTVQQQIQVLGQRAAEFLLDRVVRGVKDPPRRLVVDVRLLAGESTGPPPAQTPRF